MKKKTTHLFFLILLLVGLGLVFIYSTSAHKAIERYNDSFFFLKRQILWLFIALFAQFLCIKVPLHQLKSKAPLLMCLSLFLLLCVLIPAFSVKVGGARRWLSFLGLRFQPSELSKLLTVIGVCLLLDRYQSQKISSPLFYTALFFFVGSTLALILAEKDLGSCVILTIVVWLLMFISLDNVFSSLWILIATVPFFFFSILKNPFRIQRIFSYLNPWKDPHNTGYQIIQSLTSISRGGLCGQGIGKSVQKYSYLPEAHTDFIFSIYAEETGLCGASLLLTLFLLLLFTSGSVVNKTQNTFSYFLASGLTFLIFVQVCINLAVVTALLPTKGTTLPFFSFGGSSLIVNFMVVGLLINIEKDNHTAFFQKGKQGLL